MSTKRPAQLSPKQRAALSALVLGSSLAEAAAQAGIHRSTALAEARAQQAHWIQEGLQALAARALETVSELMTDTRTPAAVRLRAATLVISAATVDPYTEPALPKSTSNAEFDQMIDLCYESGAEEQRLREIMKAEDAFRYGTPDQTPRNAPCPCGSREKYKRC